MAKLKTALYPSAGKYTRKTVTWDKKRTVPNQSMSLQEIIKRFTRKEALPLEKEAVYEDRFGDLEQLSREDITVRRERAQDIKRWADKGSKLHEENEKKAAEEQKKKDEEEFVKRVKGIQGEKPGQEPDKPKT